MEQGEGPDTLMLGLKPGQVWLKGILELSECVEMLVHQGRVRQTPQTLGGLQLWSMGRQKHQADALGNPKFPGYMPTRLVEHQHNVFIRSHPIVSSKRAQDAFKGFDTDLWKYPEVAVSRLRAGKGIQIKPFKAVFHLRHQRFSALGPYFTQDGLET